MANVLFIIEHLSGGGAERVVAEISAELESVHRVSLIIFEDRGTTYRHCNNLTCLNIPGTRNVFLKPINLVRRICTVRKIKKRNHIDATISFIGNSNLVNVLSGGKNKVCSVRTVLSSVAKNALRKRVEKYILRKADYVLSLSEYVKHDLIINFSVPKGKIQTIYNPIFRHQSYVLSNDNSSNISRKDGLHFITAGRMVTAKGQWHIIKSFYSYRKRYSGKLTLLGDGPLRSQLEDLVGFLNLTDSVIFKGFVDNPIEEYKQADVFIMSSLWEGFGNVIIEAMDNSLPIICPECPGGPREILNPRGSLQNGFEAEYGLLTKPFPQVQDIEKKKELTKEEENLCEAMVYLTNSDVREKFSHLSAIRAHDFTIDKIVGVWNSFIAEITQQGL